MRDFLSALRTFRRSPGFVLAAVLSLALGIGANTAIFNLLNALILRPLPVPHPGRLVRIGSFDPTNGSLGPLPSGVLDSLRTNPLLDGVCAVQTPLSTVEVHGTLAPVAGHALSGDCYRTLEIQPALGRLIAPPDDVPNGPRVTVLDYKFWQSEFGGHPTAIGQSIRIEGVPFTIIGVTPASFHGLLLGFPPRVSFPITQKVNPDTFGSARPANAVYWAQVFARVKPGVTIPHLETQLRTSWQRTLDAALPPNFPAAERQHLLHLPVVVADGSTGLDYTLRSRFRQPLWCLLAIAAMVFLISCVNVANLLLARGLRRQKEFAVRTALGAPRWRLLCQMGAESFALVAAGLGLAVLFATQGDRALLASYGRNFSAMDLNIASDWRTLLFTGTAALLALLLFGLIPAWQSTGINPAALKAAARSVAGAHSRTRGILLAGQVALTVALVCGAGVFIETLRNLQSQPTGLDPTGVLTVQLMSLPGGRGNHFDGAAYALDLTRRLESLPQVESVALTSTIPFFNRVPRGSVRPSQGSARPVEASYTFVGDHFFSALRIPLLQGRDFRHGPQPGGTQSVIVSASLAHRLFPAGKAIGRRIDLGDYRNLEIAGIAADTQLDGPRTAGRFCAYLNLWENADNLKWPALLIRGRGNLAPIADSVRRTIREAGHNYADRVSTLAGERDLSFFRERLIAWLASAFGALALVLAAVGLYGILSYYVASRTSEIGIRMALGADQSAVRWLVVREALCLLAAGFAAGAPLVYIGIRALSSLLYETGKFPAAPLAAAASLLVLVTVLSAWLPARRATAIDPLTALRTE